MRITHEIDHSPIKPPRPGTPGEGIYLRLWQEYLETDPERIDKILWNVRGPTTQRDATVCASYMVFMGCNGGRSLHQAAEALMRRHGLNEGDAFTLAWAKDNARHRGLSRGLRTIEFILAPQYPIHVEGLRQGQVNWDLVPDVSMRDIDVIDCMVAWWGSHEGAQMRAIAEPLIRAADHQLLQSCWARDCAVTSATGGTL